MGLPSQAFNGVALHKPRASPFITPRSAVSSNAAGAKDWRRAVAPPYCQSCRALGAVSRANGLDWWRRILEVLNDDRCTQEPGRLLASFRCDTNT